MIGNYFFSNSGAAAGYQIEQSLRFNSADSAYLNRTPGSAGNRKTWTWSGWLKLGALSQQRAFFAGSTANNDAGFTSIEIRNDNKLYVSGYSTNWRISTQLFRDPSAWYHIVIVWDTTQATANDRIKVYLNGSQITDFDTTNNPSQDATGGVNGAAAHYISTYDGSNWEWDGYMAEVNFIDGSALAPTDFGELDDNGVWRPKRYTGSYTGNSFYLKFASGDGTDSSGLSNTWTANNFTTSGTGTDVMSDTPTTNWCTLNPLDKNGNQVPKDGNLYFDGSVATGNLDVIAGTMRVTSGKYYWESTITNVGSIAVAAVGITKIQCVGRSVGGSLGGVSGECAYRPNGDKQLDGSSTAYGASFTTGDVIGVALDCDAGTVTFYKNGTSQGAISYAVGNGLAPAIGQVQGYGAIQTLNFGQRAFEYTPPTGFKALNTSNLPAPDIADGSQYFNTVLYTGNGQSTHAITGVGFQPNLSWVKRRNVSSNHVWQDSVRGITASNGNQLVTNATFAENANGNGHIGSYDSDGFTLEDGTSSGYPRSGTNDSGGTYVAWLWKAGTASGSSNTAGSITSTVSANPSAGFSIVSYTGTGSTATVGHGLGVQPSMIIFKNRDDGGTYDYWSVYHSAYSPSSVLYLNTTDSVGYAGAFFDTAPTSTVFQVKTENKVNGSGDDHIAYCFAEVEGYSKFGSYTGNGNADGPFVYCGFKPAWVLVKGSSFSLTNWYVYDTTRGEYNPTNLTLAPDSAGTEPAYNATSTAAIDIVSNGFKIRGSGSTTNDSGGTLIFAAFSENPFGGSGVSPATAR